MYFYAGFVAIGQDMRGTEKSEGNFTMCKYYQKKPLNKNELHLTIYSSSIILRATG